MSNNICIVHYYVPLIAGVVFAVGVAAGVSILIDMCLRRQAARIKIELREKQRRENVRRQRKE